MGSFRTDIPELAVVLDGADHVDMKSAVTDLPLSEFAAGALSFRPWWVRALFGVRAVFARLLRLKQAAPFRASRAPLRADLIPFVPGAAVSFFTVTAAQEGRCLLLQAADRHLTGYLAFVVDPPPDAPIPPGGQARRRLQVVTVVRYHHWTGPLYFTVIRPFHHLVVGGMTKAGARGVAAASVGS